MKKILTLISIVVLLFSCNKEEVEKTNDYPTSTIDDRLYPLLFKENSYWVYKNQNTGQLDSIVVNSVTKKIYLIPPSAPGQVSQGNEEYFEVNYSSSINGTYNEQLVGYVISKGFINGGFLYLSSYQIGDEAKNAKISDIYDSLAVEGNLYRNVVKMYDTKDDYLQADMNLYYSDSVGVIKKEIISNDSVIEIWNLFHYSVELYQ